MDLIYTDGHDIEFLALSVKNEKTFFQFAYHVSIQADPGRTSPVLLDARPESGDDNIEERCWDILYIVPKGWTIDRDKFSIDRVADVGLSRFNLLTEADVMRLYVSLLGPRVFQYDVRIPRVGGTSAMENIKRLLACVPSLCVLGVMDRENNDRVLSVPQDDDDDDEGRIAETAEPDEAVDESAETLTRSQHRRKMKKKRSRLAEKERKARVAMRHSEPTMAQKEAMKHVASLRQKMDAEDGGVSSNPAQEDHVMLGVVCGTPYHELAELLSSGESGLSDITLSWSKDHQPIIEKHRTKQDELIEKTLQRMEGGEGGIERRVRTRMEGLGDEFERDPEFANEYAEGMRKISTITTKLTSDDYSARIAESISEMHNMEIYGSDEEEDTETPTPAVQEAKPEGTNEDAPAI